MGLLAGRYRVVELLGKGGMAEVYRVETLGPGGFRKQLALKRILASNFEQPNLIRLFEQEARLTSILTHANITQVYEFLKTESSYVLIMEYVHGKSLAEVLLRAQELGRLLPIELAVYVINGVCQGLDYAFRKKDPRTGKPLHIIHRDISPHNIMLSYEGAVKIVDFGIAKARNFGQETRIGVIRGKLPYMSPEQASGLSVDHRSDIFSTCLVLLEILVGKRIFDHENEIEVLDLVRRCELPKFAELNPRIPARLSQILSKGLKKAPDERFQETSALQLALQEFLAGFSGTITQNALADALHELFPTGPEANTEREIVLSDQSQRELAYGLTRFEGKQVKHGGNPGRFALGDRLLRFVLIIAMGVGVFGLAGMMDLRIRGSNASLEEVLNSHAPGLEDRGQPVAKAPTGRSPAESECVLKLDTSPSGARITVNQTKFGKTPAMIYGRCGKAIDVSIGLERHQTYVGRFTLKDPAAKGEELATSTIYLSPLTGGN